MKYYLSVGSNVGNRRQHVLLALDGLNTLGRLQQISALYESAPLGVTRQRSFYNLVCTLESPLRPFRLLRKIKALETQIGRRRSYRWGPREIDIDLIDWTGQSIRSSVLNLPHTGLEERLFVLVPLREIAPDFRNRHSLDVGQMIQRCPDHGQISRIEPITF